METQIQNHIYGWRQLGTTSSKVLDCSFRSGKGKKDLYWINVLNGLAFLLVFKPGERAATTACRTSNARIVKLYWAKDVEVTSDDFNFVEKLLRTIARESEAESGTNLRGEEALCMIIPKHKFLIHRYALELAQAFELMRDRQNLWSWDDILPSDHLVRKALIEAGLVGPTDSIAKFLDGFIKVGTISNHIHSI